MERSDPVRSSLEENGRLPSPLAASRVSLQCLGESTDGEVIDPVKARSSLEASKEWARISLHLWLPLG